MSENERTEYGEVKGVIFDLDNTLVNFFEAKFTACEEVVDFLDSGDPQELFRQFIEGRYHLEDTRNIKDYLKSRDMFDRDVYEECSEIYRSTKLENIELYTGVSEVLDRVREKGLKIGLITDAESVDALVRLEKVGILEYFDVTVTHDDTGKKKPDPEPFLYCLEEMGLEPEEVVLVGDNLERDISAGKEMGMVTVHARYGERDPREEENLEADHSIDEVVELLEILDSVGAR